MKIQVKTLNQKSLLVEIDAQKTVLDLKQELALYPDIGVNPEQQKLIYAGKILDNNDTLNDCKIDEKKFLVVMIVKQQQAAAAEAVKIDNEAAATAGATASAVVKNESPAATATATTTTTTSAAVTPAQATAAPNTEQDEMIANIVSMGYAENDVRLALEASFNNPERAVEYLIEGIPMSPNAGEVVGGGFVADAEEGEMSPFELLRSDPVFRNLRSLIQQNPELIDEAVQRISEANPALLTIINEHQQEFLNMLFEQVDDDDDVDE